jgi:hypothetical protein
LKQVRQPIVALLGQYLARSGKGQEGYGKPGKDAFLESHEIASL